MPCPLMQEGFCPRSFCQARRSNTPGLLCWNAGGVFLSIIFATGFDKTSVNQRAEGLACKGKKPAKNTPLGKTVEHQMPPKKFLQRRFFAQQALALALLCLPKMAEKCHRLRRLPLVPFSRIKSSFKKPSFRALPLPVFSSVTGLLGLIAV